VTTGPFAEATAYEMVVAVAERHAARPAMVAGDARMTFADFRARVDALAGGLGALGLRHGDALAIWLPNRPLWFIAQYAAARLGIIVVALNPRYRAREPSYILAQSDAAALLFTDHLGPVDYVEILHEALPDLASAVPGELALPAFPKLRHVLVDADGPYPGCWRVGDVHDAGRGAQDVAAGPTADDVFTLLYTSGTTGIPQGGDDLAPQLRAARLEYRGAATAHARRPRAPHASRGRHVGRPQRPAVDVEPRRLPRAHGDLGPLAGPRADRA
jgi:acyl-CoA synthetase (AMP-forming)/AMP-acid ligase II